MTPKQMDCAACEQELLGAKELEDPGETAGVRDHLAGCPQCVDLYQSLKEVKPFLDRCRVPQPAPQLVENVLLAAQRLLPGSLVADASTLGQPSRLFRIVLATLAALPVVVLINGALGWLLFEVASLVFPRTFALYCIGLFAAWVSLGVSLSYASLPFLSLLAARPPDRAWRR